jgi:hypothetical protein
VHCAQEDEANFYCLADFISAHCDMFMHLIRRSGGASMEEIIKLPVRCEVKDTKKNKKGERNSIKSERCREMREGAPLYTYFSDNSQIIITETSN